MARTFQDGWDGKTKSRAEDMKKVRQRRKDAGLVEFRAWVTPDQKKAIEYAIKDMRLTDVYREVLNNEKLT